MNLIGEESWERYLKRSNVPDWWSNFFPAVRDYSFWVFDVLPREVVGVSDPKGV